jgi:hypothetical protein
MIARSALAAVLLAQLLLGTDCALVGWWAFDAEGGDSCPDRAGGPAAPLDLTGGAVVSLGDSNETHALRLWGNATSGTAFEVPHHSKIDDIIAAVGENSACMGKIWVQNGVEHAYELRLGRART